jgi:N-acyl-D-aspartate/D-glutamate deacylase
MIRVAGDTQCANELIEAFEQKLGRKFSVKYESEVVMRALLKAAVDHKNFGLYFEKAVDVFTGDGVSSRFSPIR